MVKRGEWGREGNGEKRRGGHTEEGISYLLEVSRNEPLRLG
jgi:hypothetical protein